MLAENRILILYSNYGEGHFQAARAIQEVADKNEDLQVFLFDMMEWTHPLFHSISQPLFIKGVSTFPRLYGHIYEKTKGQATPYLLKQFLRTGLKRMQRLLNQIQPTLVLSTFPFAAAAMSMMKAYGLTHVPTATLITDHCNHRSWIHPYTDHYFVGSEEVYNQLSGKWVSGEQMSVTGIPVRPAFTRPYNHYRLKQQLGLKNNLPTLLVMGGGYGMIGKEISEILEQIHQTIQVVVICGKNKKRRREITEAFAHSRHDVLVKGYVHNIHEWMATADVLITKPGGSTISEALAMKLPMILYQTLPGQEQANADFLCHHQMAVEAKNQDELKNWVDQMCDFPQLRVSMSERMQLLQPSRSTEQILQQIKQFT